MTLRESLCLFCFLDRGWARSIEERKDVESGIEEKKRYMIRTKEQRGYKRFLPRRSLSFRLAAGLGYGCLGLQAWLSAEGMRFSPSIGRGVRVDRRALACGGWLLRIALAFISCASSLGGLPLDFSAPAVFAANVAWLLFTWFELANGWTVSLESVVVAVSLTFADGSSGSNSAAGLFLA